MAKLKRTKAYYFSVEGHTEKWYLDWLENIINATDEAIIKVSIKSEVQKDPAKFAKKLTVINKTTVYHLSDYESNELEHVTNFHNTMDRMKKASSDKQITYKFGYSNLTFDLWIILHMTNLFGAVADRKNYLNAINRSFNESFESMDEYKEEINFKRCLSKLKISNIIDAVNRSKKIMKNNENNGYALCRYRNYSYYKENPSLTVWEAIAEILKDCELK